MGFFKRLWQDIVENAGPGPEDDGPEMDGPKELLYAERKAPNSEFVQGCRNYYNKYGYLSLKQKDALHNVTVNRRKR